MKQKISISNIHSQINTVPKICGWLEGIISRNSVVGWILSCD